MRNTFCALALTVLATPALAEAPGGETLLHSIPDGWVVAHSADDGSEAITEMVPPGETVERWTRMHTIQVFRGQRDVTPARFREVVGGLWIKACPEGQVMDMASGADNGYPAGLWIQQCPLTASGRPEFTFFKAIQGRDSLYVVHSAVRRVPTETDIAEAKHWLETARACDSRRPEQACPESLAPIKAQAPSRDADDTQAEARR